MSGFPAFPPPLFVIIWALLNPAANFTAERTSIIAGRAIARAVSRRLPTAAARVRSHIKCCGTGAGFLRVVRFPLPILIPPTAPHSSSLIRGCTIGRLVAYVPSGLSLTQPQGTKETLPVLAVLSSHLRSCDSTTNMVAGDRFSLTSFR
jgi:hypothetical protein